MAAPIEISREKARNWRAAGLKLSRRASAPRKVAPAICMSRRLLPGRFPGGARRLIGRRVDRPVDLLAERGLDRQRIVAAVSPTQTAPPRQTTISRGATADAG